MSAEFARFAGAGYGAPRRGQPPGAAYRRQGSLRDAGPHPLHAFVPGGLRPTKALVQNSTAAGNGTAAGTLLQPALGFVVG